MNVCASWITEPSDLCGDCLPAEVDDPTAQGIIDKWGLVASTVLWALTGRQFSGVCTDKVWPRVTGRCGQWLAYSEAMGGGSRPLVDTDGWRGWDCCPADHVGLLLPQRPGRRVVEVNLFGEVVDPSTYRLLDRRWLVRCDDVWPCFQTVCQDFTVTYEYGVPAPAGGAEMAGKLACEYQRACTPGCECRLPKRAQTIVQEGITTAVLLGDPLAMLDAGATGLPEVDLWIRSLNPHRIDRAARMLTPTSIVNQAHHLR